MHTLQTRVDIHDQALLPVIQSFQELIENDAELFMLFSLMFDEVPKKYKEDPSQHHQVRSYKRMLKLLNQIMTEAPEYNNTGLVGFPINAIFDYSMGTTAGFAAFLNPKVNRHLKVVLNEWAVYLSSPESRYVLNNTDNGWFGKPALKHMFGDDTTRFEDVFQCKPQEPFFGFRSWDEFFTREFIPGARPIASLDDNHVIVNACESSPYRIAKNVQKTAKFWIKGQPYSLQHMMAGDPYVDDFVGGTVYQAFLSAMVYHRWHSPVSGAIVKTYVIDGTYYSEALSAGFDECAPNASQGYITEVATRALIFIQADNPDIGLMCFMAVGMAEVSTCQITVYEGKHVKKGDPLGMFHFGGSTHCLFFRPEVELEFDLHDVAVGLQDPRNIKLAEKIATVVPGCRSKKQRLK